MKVVFLDVDGVLNSSRSVLARTGVVYNKYRAELENYFDGNDPKLSSEMPYGVKYTLETIDPVAVGLVNRLIRESGAVLVLSTAHRAMFSNDKIPYDSKQNMHLLGLYFGAMGIEAKIHGITPRLYGERGPEVKRYLDDNPKVTHYVILDDGRDFHSSQPLVWCDPHVGFSHTNYYAAAKELGFATSSLIY